MEEKVCKMNFFRIVFINSIRDLKKNVRVLHRLTQLQSMAVKDMVQDTFLKVNEACIGFAMSQV